MAIDRIGPYEIELPLGEGGMGQVFLAYDTRLKRRVALKVIRTERAERSRARERFRREARAAALLNHPALVRIFDIIERDEGDCIVMELVEGETLSRRVRAGPLRPRQAVEIASQIADGLDTAHRTGFVHRDLKADNVMITAAGQVKILDFGLAKQLVREPDEVSLTAEGRIVGTYYAMSPEQAQGLQLDHRADLFSLGVLLYQMVTKRAPFRGETPLDTLTRVCTHRQPPAHELEPAVPPALSALIDRLLEKDPARRPADAAEVIAALEAIREQLTGGVPAVALPAAGAAPPPIVSHTHVARALPATPPSPAGVWSRAAGRWPPFLIGLALASLGVAAGVHFFRTEGAPPRRVAVLWPTAAAADAADAADAQAGGPDRAAAGRRLAAVHDGIERGLAALTGLAVTPSDQVAAIDGVPAEVGRALGVDHLMTARIGCQAHACRIELARHDIGGPASWGETFAVPADDLHLLAAAVAAQVRGAFPGLAVRLDALPEVAEADYEAYLAVIADAREPALGGAQRSRLAARLEALIARAPGFAAAHLAAARLARDGYRVSGSAADRERLLAALERARLAAVDDPRPLVATLDAALELGQRQLVIDAATALAARVPAHPALALAQARLVELDGDPQQARALLRTALIQRPAAATRLAFAAMARRDGRDDLARAELEKLVHQHPGHRTARAALADLELDSGDPGRAIVHYEALVGARWDADLARRLGRSYLLAGRYADATARFTSVLARDGEDFEAALGAADGALLQGHRQAAEARYRQLAAAAVAAPIVRACAHAALGAGEQAVSAVQEALRLAPDDAAVAYRAARVYAAVGETTSALVNARRALQRGVGAHWFALPWFDALRDDPDFQRWLGERSA